MFWVVKSWAAGFLASWISGLHVLDAQVSVAHVGQSVDEAAGTSRASRAREMNMVNADL